MLITFDRDKATFVSLNRFEAKKNIELALEAFSLVKKDRPNASMRLVVAGMSIL
jgi:glycosyltransferase involved in cell wall biosynthesis